MFLHNMYYCDCSTRSLVLALERQREHPLLEMVNRSNPVCPFLFLTYDGVRNLFLRSSLGEVVESLAALELGVLDDT
jgi:hypothetical protein